MHMSSVHLLSSSESFRLKESISSSVPAAQYSRTIYMCF